MSYTVTLVCACMFMLSKAGIIPACSRLEWHSFSTYSTTQTRTLTGSIRPSCYVAFLSDVAKRFRSGFQLMLLLCHLELLLIYIHWPAKAKKTMNNITDTCVDISSRYRWLHQWDLWPNMCTRLDWLDLHPSRSTQNPSHIVTLYVWLFWFLSTRWQQSLTSWYCHVTDKSYEVNSESDRVENSRRPALCRFECVVRLHTSRLWCQTR